MDTPIVPGFTIANAIVSVLFAPIFIAIMSLVKEPLRQQLNAVIIAFAGGAYYSGGLGVWEYAFGVLFIFMALKGMTNYKYIAVAWIIHAVWDTIHHFYARPIDPMADFSSAACAVFDPLIAIWFFFGAPSVYDYIKKFKHYKKQ